MAVNQYDNGIYTGEPDEIHLPRPGDTDYYSRKLHEKNDPIADDIVWMARDIQKLLNQKQLMFHIKVFGMSSESAMMLASAVSESESLNGKYRILTYDKHTPNNILNVSHENSRQLTITTDVQYTAIWGAELPEGWSGRKRLCRIATIDELGGVFCGFQLEDIDLPSVSGRLPIRLRKPYQVIF